LAQDTTNLLPPSIL